MKRNWKYAAAVLPLAGLCLLLGSCSNTPVCNNDACYDRNVSSVDPYKKGDIAAWGSEKKVAEDEEKMNHRFNNPRMRNER